jgi:hypothetical protein
MKEGLLLDGIALHASGVAPRNINRAGAVETDLADSRLTLRNRATMSTRVTANAIVPEILNKG